MKRSDCDDLPATLQRLDPLARDALKYTYIIINVIGTIYTFLTLSV